MNEDKQNTISKTRRIARSVIEVFDNFLESETINKESLHLLIDKILVSEDQLEIKFKPDITALLQHGEQFFPAEALPAEIVQESKNHTRRPIKIRISSGSGEKTDPAVTCGDLFEIETVRDYSPSYMTCIEEAKAELQSNARPELKRYLDSLDGYDNVFVCGPCWWGTYPTAVFTQLEKLDWTGKKVMALMTHEGSGLAESERDLKKTCKGALFGKGLAVAGHSAADSEAQVAAWAKSQV